jgi:uncharacterized SAM-binding protein YcdF (DUF218 family)
MFVAGKIFWLIIQPLSLAFLMMALALFFLVVGWRRLAGTFNALALCILFGTLFTTAGARSLESLESRFPRPADPQSVSCMIVLGGGFDLEVSAGRDSLEMTQAADRFVEAARLARKYPEARIIVSGGDGSISGLYPGDGELAGRFFAAMGIDPKRVVADEKSRNTAENAAETKRILDREKLSNCLLITSAYHMPRAYGMFEKLDVATIPWPTDYRSSGKVSLGLDFTQPTLNAQLTSTAVREWLGLLGAYLGGKTIHVLP